jgi:hypothetical protein
MGEACQEVKQVQQVLTYTFRGHIVRDLEELSGIFKRFTANLIEYGPGAGQEGRREGRLG